VGKIYCSIHEVPFYLGTGSIFDRDENDNVVNAPLRVGDGGET
jgi:acetoin utilization deacetylase AcuC-like enzyme